MAKSVDEVYEEARKFIGKETEVVQDRYPVECDPIRRYCHMSEDTNPLFLDPEYAKKTKHRGLMCPPFFVAYFGWPGPWPPPYDQSMLPQVPTPVGGRKINLSTEWEFFKPVYVGDCISAKGKWVDVYIKPIRLDTKAFWILTEITYTNQDGELVATCRNLLLVHRSPEQIESECTAR